MARLIEALCRPSPRGAALTAAVITLLAAQYFILTAAQQQRDLSPKFHDELEYLLQARMAAHGRLWMPPHPEGEFFESFYILAKPVYAAVGFPGTALLYALGLRLGIAPWALAALTAGGIVGLIYRLITELIDGAAGLLAALLAISSARLRVFALMAMPHTVFLLLALAMIWAWLRWRQSVGRLCWLWALAAGGLAGWAAITRPLDALCFAVPLGVAWLADLRGQPWRRWAATATALIAGAAPFLILQLIFNLGVTGRLLQTPWTYYHRTTFPALTFGWGERDVSAPSSSTLPQVRDFYAQFVLPQVRGAAGQGAGTQTWWTQRGSALLAVTLPSAALAVLAVLGLCGLRDRRRWVFFAPLPLSLLAYGSYPIFLDSYLLMDIPAMALLVLLGREVVGALPRAGRVMAWLVGAGIAALALAALPQFHPAARDPAMQAPTLEDVNEKLAHLEHTPAVVLFRYHHGNDVHEEPVYNLDAAWPDDAPVIRAHDLGPEADRRIFAYYAQHQPQRFFYLYDRNDGTLYPLGPPQDAQRNLPP